MFENQRVSVEEGLTDYVELSETPREDSRRSSEGFNNKENLDLDWKLQSSNEMAAQDRLREQIEVSAARLPEAAQRFQENARELAAAYQKAAEELQNKIRDKEVMPFAPPCQPWMGD